MTTEYTSKPLNIRLIARTYKGIELSYLTLANLKITNEVVFNVCFAYLYK